MNASSNAFSVAAIQNRGGVFVSPYNSVFPFYLNELPPSIASPAWQNLSLVATGALRLRAEGAEHYSRSADLFTEASSI